MNKIIFLLSDFGVKDTYAAQMKTVIISQLPPDMCVIDLTHEIARDSVTEGAFHLYVFRNVIPAGSVVVAVVDPGVGTERRGVICEADGVRYTGPDNGLFGLLPVSRCWKLPEPAAGSSCTFHGRDVFAPAGTRLAMDPGWIDFLEPLDPDELVRAPVEMPVTEDGGLKVSVAHVDRFGNIVLWLFPSAAFHPSGIQLPDGMEQSLTEVPFYAEYPGFLYLQGSQGLMEIAVSGGNASELLGLTAGDRILLKKGDR